MTTISKKTKVLDFIIRAGRAALRRLGLSWASAILYERDLLRKPITQVNAKIPVEIVTGTPSHINLLTGLFPDKKLEQYRKRLAEGVTWILVLAEGKVVYSVWLTFLDEFEPNLGIWIKLVPGEGYIFNGYTVPEYQGLGLHKLGVNQTLVYAADKGAKRIFAYVYTDNEASRYVLNKLEFSEKELITKLSVFRWSRLITRKLGKKVNEL